MRNKGMAIFILTLLMTLLLVLPCFANAAEPPSIVILVPSAPEDLTISLVADSSGKAKITDKAFERYYAFYYRDLKYTEDYSIEVTTAMSSYQIHLEKPVKAYNNIFTLDLNQQTLEPGKSLTRSLSLVSLRVLLTLLIEAGVFWLFGYREKRSWYAFLAINLLTQGALNIWLNEFSPLASYLVFNLIIGEVQVFIVELIILMAFLREHGRLRTFSYVITANLLSLIAGGYIITYLPI
ncbi:hypothetical protein AAC978_07365 [Desulfitobacterium sp. THU1]|uniref:hypothetical protein n=1 Tax=Desulfitobacterium sp. THU1 TaxID=3138072 RepID=UPI003120275C